jgi:hypothetical protein
MTRPVPTMRAGILLAAAAMAFAMAIMAPSADAATPRRGLIVVEKRITLSFPNPGVYLGELEIARSKLARAPKNAAGKKAGRKAKGDAKHKGLVICDSSMRKTAVQVVHLSKPPFLIGAKKPTKRLEYGVVGPEPPIGDRVRASQNAATKKFAMRGFKWEVWCRRANVVHPYAPEFGGHR